MATCTHLDAIQVPFAGPATACNGCTSDGRTDWVALRQCTQCGYVGCCNSSPARHSAKHNAETAHPIIRSVQEGQRFVWCYVDATYLDDETL